VSSQTASPHAGIYTGTFAGQSDNGGFAAFVGSDGMAVIVGYSSPTREGVFFEDVQVQADGSFSRWHGGNLINGQVSGGGVTGNYVSSKGNGTFQGTQRPDTGNQQNAAGYYRGTYNFYDVITGPIHAVVAADGTLFVYTTGEAPLGPDGGFGTVNTQNQFSCTTVGGAVANGTLAPLTWTATGTFTYLTFNGTFTATRLKALAPVITTASPLPPGTNGFYYAQTFQAASGSVPFNWSVVAGNLPTGLTLGSNGALGGRPTTTGTFNFRVRVMGANGQSTEKDFHLTIYADATPPNLAPFKPAGWSDTIVVATQRNTTTDATLIYHDEAVYVDWAAWNSSLTASATPRIYYTLHLDGVLIEDWHTEGLQANSYTQITDFNLGTLSAGTHALRLMVDAQSGVTETDETDNTYLKTFTVTMRPVPPVITTTSPLPAATAGATYSQTLAAMSGVTPYSWSLVTGNLPAGLSFSGAGVLSGIPTTAATFNFRVRATGANSLSAEKDLSLTVQPPVIGPALGGKRRTLGRFELTVTGLVGLRYSLETSTNLLEWTSWTNVVCTNQSVSIIDAEAWKYPVRYYRARF